MEPTNLLMLPIKDMSNANLLIINVLPPSIKSNLKLSGISMEYNIM